MLLELGCLDQLWLFSSGSGSLRLARRSSTPRCCCGSVEPPSLLKSAKNPSFPSLCHPRFITPVNHSSRSIRTDKPPRLGQSWCCYSYISKIAALTSQDWQSKGDIKIKSICPLDQEIGTFLKIFHMWNDNEAKWKRSVLSEGGFLWTRDGLGFIRRISPPRVVTFSHHLKC